MDVVAIREGLRPTRGQSPFAIGAGVTFEQSLFLKKADRMLKVLIEAGVLPDGAKGFQDFRLRKSGGPCKNLDDALQRTRDALVSIAAARAEAPSIIAAATVRIPGDPILPEAILVIDALAVRSDENPVRLIVGEVKNYPDRGGYTEKEELSGARAQAGVYVHALSLTIQELGLQDRLRVDTSGFLVLRKPGSLWPSVRAREDLRFQALRASRGLERLKSVAAGLAGTTEKDAVDLVCRASISYETTCVSFCDRAAGCYAKMMEEGDPSVLGEDVARFLGRISLHRAEELLEGAKVKDETEAEFMKRVEEATGKP
jgi:hypothetical protein